MFRTLHSIAFTITILCLLGCGASKELTAEMATTRSALADCQDQLQATQQQLTHARAQAGDSNSQYSQLQNENATLRSDLAQAQANLSVAESQLAIVTQQMQANSDQYGIWFRVQIGAYAEREIDPNLATTDQLALEKNQELQKTSLGRFRNYQDAKQLQTQLQAMGVRDAWIVSYRDGQRVPIEEAMNR